MGHLGPDDYKEIPDVKVKTTKNGKTVEYNFTDGIGKISLKYAVHIKNELKLKFLPAAFQIRFKGTMLSITFLIWQSDDTICIRL